jgi:hypothetical protein
MEKGCTRLPEPAAIRAGNIMSTQRLPSSIRRDHVGAAPFESFQVDVPDILKRHAGDGQIVRLGPFEKLFPGTRFVRLLAGSFGFYISPTF